MLQYQNKSKHKAGESYRFTEMQLMYSTVPADWTP